MNKLIIHSNKPLSAKEANTIRAVIPDDTLAEMKKISAKTGIALSQLANFVGIGIL